MSDTPVGPGWWLASDGKWYPPADAAPPAPTGAGAAGSWGRPPGVSRTLSGWLQGLLWASAVAWALAAVLAAATRDALGDYLGRRITPEEWEEAVAGFLGLSGLGVMLTAAAVVLFVVWTVKAHNASTALAPGQRRWSKGWAIAGWFIPIAAALLPKLVLGEIERISRAPRVDGLADPDWRSQRSGPLGWLWWVAFVGGFGLWSVAVNVWDFSDVFADPDTIDQALSLHLAATLAIAVSGVLGALHVRQLGRFLASESLASEVVYY
ncbi:MAG: DUF4328 domain-containing protein [Acidimicrobiales bacterium]